MKVDNNSPINNSGSAKRKKNAGVAGFNFDAFLSDSEEVTTSDINSVFNINPFTALQEIVEDDRDLLERSKRQGYDMLDILDDLRLGILNGKFSSHKLAQLEKLIKQEKATILDPKLRNILEEIEVRAAVELAKLERRN